MPRWWFNASTGKCERFTYGGCDGNANNFQTAKACIAACATGAAAPCDAVTCVAPESCVYQAADPTCARPCEGDAGTCGAGKTCQCAGSCENCKDCTQVCL